MVNQILAFLNMSLICVLGVARKQELGQVRKLPGDVKNLSETEENSEAGDIVFDKEHDGGSDAEEPADNEAGDVADESGFDGALAELGDVLFEGLVLRLGHFYLLSKKLCHTNRFIQLSSPVRVVIL